MIVCTTPEVPLLSYRKHWLLCIVDAGMLPHSDSHLPIPPPRDGNCLNTMLPIVLPSGSMQDVMAVAIILHEEAF